MTPQNIVHAWKDEECHQVFSDLELASLPAHPSGLPSGLMDSVDLEMWAAGGVNVYDTLRILTLGCCPTGFPPCPPVGTEQLMTLGCCSVDLLTL